MGTLVKYWMVFHMTGYNGLMIVIALVILFSMAQMILEISRNGFCE